MENACCVMNCYICSHDRKTDLKWSTLFSLETTQWWQYSSKKINNLTKICLGHLFIYYRFIISNLLEFLSAHAINNVRLKAWKCYLWCSSLRSLSVFIKQRSFRFSNSLSTVKLFSITIQLISELHYRGSYCYFIPQCFTLRNYGDMMSVDQLADIKLYCV